MKSWPLVFALALPVPALACTLWGVAGNDAGGGTLISKNRDWRPDHQQVFKKVDPENGYRYVGLFAEGNSNPGIKAGTNEKGLTILVASASSVPKKVRNAQPGRGIMRRIMTDYASVDALLADAQAVFGNAKPNYYLISDRSKLLLVEIGLDGHYAYKVVEQGVATHTNHYVDERLSEFGAFKSGKSSATRYERINALLTDAPRPLTAAQFSTMSRDQHDGPSNSLWRTSSKTATLSSWIIATPASGAPHLHLVIANPGAAETTQDVVLDDAFWQGH